MPRGCLVAIAFNQGSDARLLGEPKKKNPYSSSLPEGRMWLLGWESVHYEWALDARAGWCHLELREVKG